MVFRETEGGGDMVCHLFAVTCKHDGLGDTQGLQGGDGLSTVGLNLVIDDDMTRIFPINGYMDDGTHMMAVVPLGTDAVHHLRITHADNLIPYLRTDTVTGNLLDIRDRTTVRRLIRKGITQGCTDGMGGEVLDMRCKVKEFFFFRSILIPHSSFLIPRTITGRIMNSLNSKLSMCQRAGLIEYHGIDLRQDIHVVRTLDEDTLLRGTTDATKEREGHTDDKGTGATYHQEHQSPV